jgi:hypothetical protein
MGDTPTGHAGSSPNTTQGSRADSLKAGIYEDGTVERGYHEAPQAQMQHNFFNTQPFPAQHTQQNNPQGRQYPFNMASLGSALPDMSFQNYGSSLTQRYTAGQTGPQHLYQMQSPPISSPSGMSSQTANMPYTVQYTGQYPMYAPGQNSSGQNMGTAGVVGNQFYQDPGHMGQQQGSPFFAVPGQYGHGPQMQMYAGNPLPTQFGQRVAYQGDGRSTTQQRSTDSPGTGPGGAGRSGSIGEHISEVGTF